MSYETILNFWFPNNKYNEFWFDGTVDNYIKKNFSDILTQAEDINSELHNQWMNNLRGKVALVIVLDQFTRNIYRNTGLIYKNDELALKIANDIMINKQDDELPLNHRLFVLLPFRHTKLDIYLDFVIDKILDYEYEFQDSKLLERFKTATYQNYSKINNFTNIKLNNEKCYILDMLDYQTIFDQHILNYKLLLKTNINNYDYTHEKLYIGLKNYFENKIHDFDERIIGISLSGGVDSMVILYLLKILELNKVIKKVYAIHIQHYNRAESKIEANFIKKYCSLIDVDVYTRQIYYMLRNEVEREFYESETKKVRFNTYKFLMENLNIKGICLGHHFGDLGENVLMNIFNGRDILDLFVMDNDTIINNVRLFRPLLDNTKNEIYEFAHDHKIPYFKNSTPEWSCRGVIRNKIMPVLETQWGSNIHTQLAEIGNKSRDWNMLVNKFILNPILNNVEFKKHGCKIILKPEYKDVPETIWTKIFVNIFHKLNKNMITRKNLSEFIKKISINLDNSKYNVSSKIMFSNNCFGVFENNHVYIFVDLINTITPTEIENIDETTYFEWNKFKIHFEKVDFVKDNFNNKQITYDDILNGYYEYTEEYVSSLYILNKFNDNDSTRKKFSKISLIREFIPKITSGYGNIPTKLIKIKVNF